MITLSHLWYGLLSYYLEGFVLHGKCLQGHLIWYEVLSKVAGPTLQETLTMRPWVVPVLLSLLVHAQAARELKWGWTSAGSLGQLTTTTGANSNAGLLST